MSEIADASRSVERFGTRIERADGADFPFYAGRPFWVSRSRWVVVVAVVAVGYLALVLLGGWLDGPYTGFIPPLLFAGIPLAAFIWAVGHRWVEISVV